MRIVRIIGFFALLSLLSCDIFHKEPTPCAEVAGVYFTPVDATVSSRKVTPCCNDELLAFDFVSFKDYLLRLQYTVQYHAQALPSSPSLFSSAYAYSCPENGQNGSRVSLDELEIITLYDIDEQHKKGSPVNDLFDFEETGNRLPLSYYLSGNDRRIRDEMALLRLNLKPQLSDTCAFKISVILDNGKKFTSISTPVIFH
ncbi:MAG: hypothetical protein ACYC1Q_11740 [Bacteroidia bacterium]